MRDDFGNAKGRVQDRAATASTGNDAGGLAAKAGLNRVTLARLERAMHLPGLDTLEAIARALSVTLADLVK